VASRLAQTKSAAPKASAQRQIDAFFPKKPQRGLSEIRVRAPRQERGIVTTRSAGGLAADPAVAMMPPRLGHASHGKRD